MTLNLGKGMVCQKTCGQFAIQFFSMYRRGRDLLPVRFHTDDVSSGVYVSFVSIFLPFHVDSFARVASSSGAFSAWSRWRAKKKKKDRLFKTLF